MVVIPRRGLVHREGHLHGKASQISEQESRRAEDQITAHGVATVHARGAEGVGLDSSGWIEPPGALRRRGERRRRANARSEIEDPSLGKLRWDANWQGQVKTCAFGKRVPLVVEVFEDFADPPQEQREAFAQYQRAEAQVFRQVERLLFDYYAENLDELRSFKPAIRTPNKKLPNLKKPSEIWKLAKVEAIVVPIQEKKKARVVAVDFKTAWDRDHGTRAVIENGKAKRLAAPGEGL
jgi:hypothetical protein